MCVRLLRLCVRRVRRDVKLLLKIVILGVKDVNTLCSQPFSNNGTKIYGVHTPHSTMRALNAAFFIHAKIEENLCVFFGRSLFCFALFHFTLLTQNFSVLGFLFFSFQHVLLACYQWCVWWWQRSTFNS